jgi:hypothetical protein
MHTATSTVPAQQPTFALRGFVQKLERSGTHIFFAGVRPTIKKRLDATDFGGATVRYTATAAAALEQIKAVQNQQSR